MLNKCYTTDPSPTLTVIIIRKITATAQKCHSRIWHKKAYQSKLAKPNMSNINSLQRINTKTDFIVKMSFVSSIECPTWHTFQVPQISRNTPKAAWKLKMLAEKNLLDPMVLGDYCRLHKEQNLPQPLTHLAKLM